MWSFIVGRSKVRVRNHCELPPTSETIQKRRPGSPSCNLVTFLCVKTMTVLELTATVGRRKKGPMQNNCCP